MFANTFSTLHLPPHVHTDKLMKHLPKVMSAMKRDLTFWTYMLHTVTEEAKMCRHELCFPLHAVGCTFRNDGTVRYTLAWWVHMYLNLYLN